MVAKPYQLAGLFYDSRIGNILQDKVDFYFFFKAQKVKTAKTGQISADLTPLAGDVRFTQRSTTWTTHLSSPEVGKANTYLPGTKGLLFLGSIRCIASNLS